MPINNIRIIILAIIICVYCTVRITYRELVLLHSMRQVESLALSEPSEKLLFEGAMQGMFDAMDEELGDQYSTYISPKEDKVFREMLDSRIEGIGVRFDPTTEKGTFKVLFPIIGSPAEKAGVRAGDTILKVDGEESEPLDIGELSAKIKGPAGTEVVLTVLHPGEEEPVDIRISRDAIQQSTVYGFNVSPSGEPIATLPDHPSIAYAYIASFNDHTFGELLRLLETLPQKVDKLILDLRGNPGGYLGAAVKIADMFVDNRGPYREIVTTKMKNGVVKYPSPYYATPGKAFQGEVLLLIDGGSASAAEILAACLQDFERAKVLGERSYGKGTVQEIFDLPFKSQFGSIKLTDATYWRPSGKNINRVRKASKSESEQEGKAAKLSEESDDWGVRPDPGLEMKLSRNQKSLTYLLRDLRSAIPERQRNEILERFAEILTKDASKFSNLEEDIPEEEESDEHSDSEEQEKESDEVKSKAFKPEGKAPYYDPILDKAIEILQNTPKTPEPEARPEL